MKINDEVTRPPEGVLLRSFRIRADLTQQEVADKSGYSPALVGFAEIGSWRPNDEYIAKVSVVLGLSVDEQLALLAARELLWKRQNKRTTGRLRIGNKST